MAIAVLKALQYLGTKAVRGKTSQAIWFVSAIQLHMALQLV